MQHPATYGVLAQPTYYAVPQVCQAATVLSTHDVSPSVAAVASAPILGAGPFLINCPPVPTVRKSKYRGVTWDKRDQRWRVRINCLGVQHHVGRYAEELVAAQVYDKVSFLLYGQHAITNFGVAAAAASPTPIPYTMLQLKARFESSKGRPYSLAPFTPCDANPQGPQQLLVQQHYVHGDAGSQPMQLLVEPPVQQQLPPGAGGFQQAGAVGRLPGVDQQRLGAGGSPSAGFGGVAAAAGPGEPLLLPTAYQQGRVVWVPQQMMMQQQQQQQQSQLVLSASAAPGQQQQVAWVPQHVMMLPQQQQQQLQQLAQPLLPSPSQQQQQGLAYCQHTMQAALSYPGTPTIQQPQQAVVFSQHMVPTMPSYPGTPTVQQHDQEQQHQQQGPWAAQVVPQQLQHHQQLVAASGAAQAQLPLQMLVVQPAGAGGVVPPGGLVVQPAAAGDVVPGGLVAYHVDQPYKLQQAASEGKSGSESGGGVPHLGLGPQQQQLQQQEVALGGGGAYGTSVAAVSAAGGVVGAADYSLVVASLAEQLGALGVQPVSLEAGQTPGLTR